MWDDQELSVPMSNVGERLDMALLRRRKKPLPGTGERRMMQPIEEHHPCGNTYRRFSRIFGRRFKKSDE
jgi:hypothetical protein